MLPSFVLRSPVAMALGWVVVALEVGLYYFYFFNRRTRQSIHDLICGTYVVKASAAGPVGAGPVAKHHYAFYAGQVACLYAALSVGMPQLLPGKTAENLFALQARLEKMEGSVGASVVDGRWFGPRQPRSFLMVRVFLKSRPPAPETVAEEAARLAFLTYSGAQDKAVISITVTHGFDIGIARRLERFMLWMPPEEWQAMFQASTIAREIRLRQFRLGVVPTDAN
jgi:hypothetical protein